MNRRCLAALGAALMLSVAASGAAFFTFCAAMTPPPPEMFSTMNDWPIDLVSRSATVRAVRSTPPPGCTGAMIFTGLEG